MLCYTQQHNVHEKSKTKVLCIVSGTYFCGKYLPTFIFDNFFMLLSVHVPFTKSKQLAGYNSPIPESVRS